MLCRARNRGRLGMPGFSCKCCQDFGPGANPGGRRLLKRRERQRWRRQMHTYQSAEN